MDGVCVLVLANPSAGLFGRPPIARIRGWGQGHNGGSGYRKTHAKKAKRISCLSKPYNKPSNRGSSKSKSSGMTTAYSTTRSCCPCPHRRRHQAKTRRVLASTTSGSRRIPAPPRLAVLATSTFRRPRARQATPEGTRRAAQNAIVGWCFRRCNQEGEA